VEPDIVILTPASSSPFADKILPDKMPCDKEVVAVPIRDKQKTEALINTS